MKDLLERFRDLVIVAAVEDAFERRLVGGSDDQRSRGCSRRRTGSAWPR